MIFPFITLLLYTIYCQKSTENIKYKCIYIDKKRIQGDFIYNNEIHILGNAETYFMNCGLKHYKWNGSSWSSASTLPYYFAGKTAVVLDNKIHLIGSSWFKSYYSTYYDKHYVWDGTNWTDAGNLPYSFGYGVLTVINNIIHIMGSNNSENYRTHYKINEICYLVDNE